jgi:hypothetical protein
MVVPIVVRENKGNYGLNGPPKLFFWGFVNLSGESSQSEFELVREGNLCCTNVGK